MNKLSILLLSDSREQFVSMATILSTFIWLERGGVLHYLGIGYGGVGGRVGGGLRGTGDIIDNI